MMVVFIFMNTLPYACKVSSICKNYIEKHHTYLYIVELELINGCGQVEYVWDSWKDFHDFGKDY